MSEWNPPLSRRACLSMLTGAMAAWSARAQASQTSFDQWVAAFRARARARGIADATYTRVMSTIKPDTAVFELNRYQPEFNEQLWQYLNRRVSDWRITTGKEKAQEYASLFTRIEKDHGVDRGIMLGLWGIESAFGDPDVQKNHMRPVISAVAAVAWREGNACPLAARRAKKTPPRPLLSPRGRRSGGPTPAPAPTGSRNCSTR